MPCFALPGLISVSKQNNQEALTGCFPLPRSPLWLAVSLLNTRYSEIPHNQEHFISSRRENLHKILTLSWGGSSKDHLSFRGTLPSYSSGVVSGVYHPSSHPLHTAPLHGTAKRPHSASQSASSNSHSFRLKSDLGSRCSWKFVAIFFMLFSFLLVSALIYTAGKGSLLSSVICIIQRGSDQPV